MKKTIDCHFWNPDLRLEDTLEFTYEHITEDIELKKPVFTVESLEKILGGIKKTRQGYLLTMGIPDILDVIGRVTDRWMDPEYKGRQIAREILPAVTGFSVEMLEYWGFDYFISTLRKENLPLFGKLQPQNFKEFSKLSDGLVVRL